MITRAWIHAHKTGPGGWTKAQLRAIGVRWPPKKGWLSRSIGRVITEAQADAFEKGKERPSLIGWFARLPME